MGNRHPRGRFASPFNSRPDIALDRTTLTYPGSNAVAYTFSNAGRLSSLQDWGSRTTSYTYTPSGLAATATLPNGLVTTYTYDRAQRLTALSNIVGSTTITSHSYTLDNEGNSTAQTEFVSGVTTGASDSFGYAYDGLNRLTAVTTTNAESFTLDSASNISSRTGPSATFSYDASNRLTGDGGQTFTWSNADRLTGRGSDSFGYDPLDRLTSSTVSGTSRTYAYNGDGLLQSRTQGSTTNLLWDSATSPSRLLQIGSDKIVYGLGPLYLVSGTATVTFARDGGKSVRAELSGSGAVNASFRYRAYGEIAQSAGSTTPSSLGYAGQLFDGSGLYFMRARWYEPASGRFVTRDPVLGDSRAPATLNGFGGAGNPISATDPTGLTPHVGDPCAGCDDADGWQPPRGSQIPSDFDPECFGLFQCGKNAVLNPTVEPVVTDKGIVWVVVGGIVVLPSVVSSSPEKTDAGGASPNGNPPPPGGWSQRAKRAIAKILAGIARADRPTAQSHSAAGSWWEYEVDGERWLVVEHPDGTVHVGEVKPQSTHLQGGAPKFYDRLGAGHL